MTAQEQCTALLQALVKDCKTIQTCQDLIRVHGRETPLMVREYLARCLKRRRKMLRLLDQYGPSCGIDVRDTPWKGLTLYDVAMWLRYLILFVGIWLDVVVGLGLLHCWLSLGERAPPGSRRAWPAVPALIYRQ
jgi:hypothetical protein